MSARLSFVNENVSMDAFTVDIQWRLLRFQSTENRLSLQSLIHVLQVLTTTATE